VTNFNATSVELTWTQKGDKFSVRYHATVSNCDKYDFQPIELEQWKRQFVLVGLEENSDVIITLTIHNSAGNTDKELRVTTSPTGRMRYMCQQ